ncbi:hypothetical protein WJX81_005183 [Elliptochloris bilobata]|uniref:acetyl-CoA C-acetyltransferase n=1 Tax=Elliptochloris bilobata TaxID=381761 RepID=A0AAW1SI91_9CHLO
MAHQCEVCIVSAVRTPLGGFQGALASLPATQLGALAIRAALERIGLAPGAVQECIMGNVCSAGLGQAPARQAALGAGLPPSVVCTTVNKVCASGLKAVALAAQSIRLGAAEVAVAGGMESMSRVPYYAPGARAGLRMGHAQLLDGMLLDGLWDHMNDVHMGECAERCAEEYGISRREQDDHALESHRRAGQATRAGITAEEIVPVDVPGRRGMPSIRISKDEAPAKLDAGRLRSLRPAFRPGGSVTAGNSSPLADGAAALVLASSAAAARLGLPVLAHLRGCADAEQDPVHFTTAPAAAIPRALAAAGLAPGDVDFYEINEAFSVVDLVNRRLLGLDPARVNAHGGAVALGHPIGASGAALLVRLLGVLRHAGARTGVAAVCNGGGGASAAVIQLA